MCFFFKLWFLCVCANRKCKTCSSKKQSFICGSDNRTYSSLCRLDYHNCVHNTATKSACKGFCPCKGSWIQPILSWKLIFTAHFLSRTDVYAYECQPQELSSIGNRLLDWFSVIMADSKKQKRRTPKSKGNFIYAFFNRPFVLLSCSSKSTTIFWNRWHCFIPIPKLIHSSLSSRM